MHQKNLKEMGLPMGATASYVVDLSLGNFESRFFMTMTHGHVQWVTFADKYYGTEDGVEPGQFGNVEILVPFQQEPLLPSLADLHHKWAASNADDVEARGPMCAFCVQINWAYNPDAPLHRVGQAESVEALTIYCYCNRQRRRRINVKSDAGARGRGKGRGRGGGGGKGQGKGRGRGRIWGGGRRGAGRRGGGGKKGGGRAGAEPPEEPEAGAAPPDPIPEGEAEAAAEAEAPEAGAGPGGDPMPEAEAPEAPEAGVEEDEYAFGEFFEAGTVEGKKPEAFIGDMEDALELLLHYQSDSDHDHDEKEQGQKPAEEDEEAALIAMMEEADEGAAETIVSHINVGEPGAAGSDKKPVDHKSEIVATMVGEEGSGTGLDLVDLAFKMSESDEADAKKALQTAFDILPEEEPEEEEGKGKKKPTKKQLTATWLANARPTLELLAASKLCPRQNRNISLVFFADTAAEPKRTAWMWWDDITQDQLMGRIVHVDSKKDIQFVPKSSFGVMMSLSYAQEYEEGSMKILVLWLDCRHQTQTQTTHTHTEV